MNVLQDIHLISLATNIPGPVAADRLRKMGASLVKVELPKGDALAQADPSWYADLHQDAEILRLDLKTAAGREMLGEYLARSDLLLTSSRPSALSRLGLEWPALARRYPRLCQVAIIGYPPPHEEKPGHDLTYQAALDLVEPPNIPRTLLADLGGAEMAVSAALALLYRRERAAANNVPMGVDQRFAWVPLSDAATFFAEPLRRGLTSPGGMLGGMLPGYYLYRTKDGWIAVAALEPHFKARLAQGLGLSSLTHEALQDAFLLRGAQEWEAWASERDIPLVAVK